MEKFIVVEVLSGFEQGAVYHVALDQASNPQFRVLSQEFGSVEECYAFIDGLHSH
jgi:hypothetical protein